MRKIEESISKKGSIETARRVACGKGKETPLRKCHRERKERSFERDSEFDEPDSIGFLSCLLLHASSSLHPYPFISCPSQGLARIVEGFQIVHIGILSSLSFPRAVT